VERSDSPLLIGASTDEHHESAASIEISASAESWCRPDTLADLLTSHAPSVAASGSTACSRSTADRPPAADIVHVDVQLDAAPSRFCADALTSGSPVPR